MFQTASIHFYLTAIILIMHPEGVPTLV